MTTLPTQEQKEAYADLQNVADVLKEVSAWSKQVHRSAEIALLSLQEKSKGKIL